MLYKKKNYYLPCKNLYCGCCLQVLVVKNGRNFLQQEGEVKLGETGEDSLVRSCKNRQTVS